MRWLDIAQSMGEYKELREGKIVYTGVLTGSHPKAEENDELPDVDQVYQVTIRSIDKKGKQILQQRDENDALQAAAVMQQALVVDVTAAVSLLAAGISYKMKLPMADSLILATAKSMNAILWTQDSDFIGITDVRYSKK